MLYIIAILLLILVLAIPAARNILFALLAGALGLVLVGLGLAGVALFGWWLLSTVKALNAPAARTPTTLTPPTFSMSNIQSGDVLLVLVFFGVAAFILFLIIFKSHE